MAVLVNAVAFFTAVVVGTRIKLEILASHLITASRRLFGIPNFRLYALADGTLGGARPIAGVRFFPRPPIARASRAKGDMADA